MTQRKTYEQFRLALEDVGFIPMTALHYTNLVKSLMNKPRHPSTIRHERGYKLAFQLFSRWSEGKTLRGPRFYNKTPAKNRVPARAVVREMKRLWNLR